MAVVPTAITVTPLFDGTKQMTVLGTMAVEEHVAVTVTGVVDTTDAQSPIVPEGLVLLLVSETGRIEYARFPSETGETWGTSGSNATCTLKLNTTALQHHFYRLSDTDVCGAELRLENGTTNNLYGRAYVGIQNWRQNPLSPVAGSGLLQAQLDVLTTRIGAHQHDDSEGSASFPHNNLTGRDAVGAHPALEATAAGAAAAVAVNASAITALQANKANKPAQSVLDDMAALAEVPSEFTDNQLKTKVNMIIGFINSLGGSL